MKVSKNVMKRFMLFAALLFSIMAVKAQKKTPQVLWCEGNTTLYFINSETVYNVNDTFTYTEKDGTTTNTNVTLVWKGDEVTKGSWIYDGIVPWAITYEYYYYEDEGGYLEEVYYTKDATRIVIDESFSTVQPETGRYYFATYGGEDNYVTSIEGLEYLDTSQMTTMTHMFAGCQYLTSLDLSKFNTANVKSLWCMFAACYSLTSLDLSSFNTENVMDMGWMFYECFELTSLNLSTFNTAKVTSLWGTFRECTSLTSLDLSSFNTEKVTNMKDLFWECNPDLVVYIGDKWSTDGVKKSGTTDVTDDVMMFNKGPIGGAGTKITDDGLEIITFDGSYHFYGKDETYAPKKYAKADTPDDAGLLTDRVYLRNDNKEGKTQTVLDAFKSDEPIPVPIQLYGRTLFKDSHWNTLCLPFSLSAEQIAASPLQGATIMQLDNMTESGGKLKLNFTEATEITAGTPYIIKWSEGDNISNPDFQKGLILSTTEAGKTTVTTESGKEVTFQGTFVPATLVKDDKKNLFLDANDELKYPNVNDYKVNGFRGYFKLNEAAQAAASTMVMSFDDGTTDIELVLSDTAEPTFDMIYDLQGRRVTRPSKGIYIINGKKVVR